MRAYNEASRLFCDKLLPRELTKPERFPAAAKVVGLEGAKESKMEFNCPTCQTKLRVSDEHANPKVRCRACGTIFRPLESGGAIPRSPAPQVSPQVNRFPDQPKPTASPFASIPRPERDSFAASTPPARTTPRPVITPRSAPSGRKGGWGIIFFIILMLLSRGPRLLKNFQRPPAPPQPIQIDHDQIMRQLPDIRDRAKLDENGELKESDEVQVVPLPEDAIRDDFNPADDFGPAGEPPVPIENAP